MSWAAGHVVPASQAPASLQVPQAGILMRLLNSLLFEPLLMLAADAFLLGEHCPRFCPGIMNVHTATNTKVSPRMRDLMRQIHLLGDIE